MSTQWIAGSVCCPYYRRTDEARHEIVCESANPEAAGQTLRFDSRAAYQRQLRLFCCAVETCRRCEQYRAVTNLRYAGEAVV